MSLTTHLPFTEGPSQEHLSDLHSDIRHVTDHYDKDSNLLETKAKDLWRPMLRKLQAE